MTSREGRASSLSGRNVTGSGAAASSSGSGRTSGRVGAGKGGEGGFPIGEDGGGGMGQESLMSSRQPSRSMLPDQQQQQAREGAGQRPTLLGCVPVEREYKLLESCRTSQRRFRQEAEAVAQKYAAIKRVCASTSSES